MALKNDRYTYRVIWSEEDHEYVGVCAEFPSLSWLTSTTEATLRGIRKVVAEVVADLEANGELVPEPIATKQYSGKFLVRVPPELHRRLVLEAAVAVATLWLLSVRGVAEETIPVSTRLDVTSTHKRQRRSRQTTHPRLVRIVHRG